MVIKCLVAITNIIIDVCHKDEELFSKKKNSQTHIYCNYIKNFNIIKVYVYCNLTKKLKDKTLEIHISKY